MTDPWSTPDPDNPWTAPTTRTATLPDAWLPSPYQPPPTDADAAVALRKTFAEQVNSFVCPLVAMVLLGAPLGLLWTHFTPRIGVAETAAGLQLTSPEGKAFFAVEGWFFLLSVAVGIASAVVVWRLLRGRSPAVPAGLVVGALLGAQIASTVGGRVVVDGRVHRFCTMPGATCSLYDGTLAIRAHAILLVWAFVAVVTYLLLTAVFDREPPPESAWPAPVWPPAP